MTERDDRIAAIRERYQFRSEGHVPDTYWLLDELARVDAQLLQATKPVQVSMTPQESEVLDEIRRFFGPNELNEADRKWRAALADASPMTTRDLRIVLGIIDRLQAQSATAPLKIAALEAEVERLAKEVHVERLANESISEVIEDLRNELDASMKRAEAAELRLSQVENTINASVSRVENGLRASLNRFPTPGGESIARSGQLEALRTLRADLGFGDPDGERAASSAPIPTVPRGHCNRCDRCGWTFGFGSCCTPATCSRRPVLPPRDTCAGCGATYAQSGRPTDLGFGESPASEPNIESKDERCPTCGQWPEDDYPDSQRDPD